MRVAVGGQRGGDIRPDHVKADMSQRELPGKAVDDVQRDGEDNGEAAADENVFFILVMRYPVRPVHQMVCQQQRGDNQRDAAETHPERHGLDDDRLFVRSSANGHGALRRSYPGSLEARHPSLEGKG